MGRYGIVPRREGKGGEEIGKDGARGMLGSVGYGIWHGESEDEWEDDVLQAFFASLWRLE